MYLFSLSVATWKSAYLSEVQVRRIDPFIFLNPVAPDCLMFFTLRNKLEWT